MRRLSLVFIIWAVIVPWSIEAQVLTERWRRVYNGVRPHSALGYRPPAPEARLTRPPRSNPASDRTGEADP